MNARRCRRFRFALVSLGFAASAVSAQILNSERIEQTFGSYGIDVLASDDELRLSNLYSEHAGERVMRTFAVVSYPDAVNDAFAGEHAEILEGGSIGATFERAGWTVIKINESIAGIAAPAGIARAMGVAAGSELAVHVYRLDVMRGGARFEYATIIEMHHPDYLDEEALRSIYAANGPAEEGLSEASRARIRLGMSRFALPGSALGEQGTQIDNGGVRP